MSRLVIEAANQAGCFPRVSGDEPYTPDGTRQWASFSPRERG